jgi:hypothetical protein
MNTLDGNVIAFRPESGTGELYLALSIGNGARAATRCLGNALDGVTELTGSGKAMDGMASELAEIADRCADLATRLEHCLSLRRQMADL